MCPHENHISMHIFQWKCLVSQFTCLKTIQILSVMEVQIRPTALFASDGIPEHAFPRFLGGFLFSCFRKEAPKRKRIGGEAGDFSLTVNFVWWLLCLGALCRVQTHRASGRERQGAGMCTRGLCRWPGTGGDGHGGRSSSKRRAEAGGRREEGAAWRWTPQDHLQPLPEFLDKPPLSTQEIPSPCFSKSPNHLH